MTTNIEWTDETWNPMKGCSRVSEGCERCYAELQAIRQSAPGKPYAGLVRKTPEGIRWTRIVRFSHEELTKPLGWRRPRHIFVDSMGDAFHEELSDEDITSVFAVMGLTSRHRYQILTKRAEQMHRWVTRPGRLEAVREAASALLEARGLRGVDTALKALGWPLPNCWLGVSVENQRWLDTRIPLLTKTPAALRFLSVEPLLGPVRLGPHLAHDRIRWVIVGGESSQGEPARPLDLEWVRSIIAECKAAGVSVFVKQLGSAWASASGFAPRDKGGNMRTWPRDLRVRELPGIRPRIQQGAPPAFPKKIGPLDLDAICAAVRALEGASDRQHERLRLAAHFQVPPNTIDWVAAWRTRARLAGLNWPFDLVSKR